MENPNFNIFTYGCSFTSYNWPSYADILGLQYKVYNRGTSGSGNERIFHSFMRDVKYNHISANDLVILQWSGTNRFNYLTPKGKWIGDGNLLLPQNKSIYNKIKGWYNPDYENEKNINLILGAEAIAKQIGCKIIEMSLHPLSGIDKKFLENDLQNTYHGEYQFTEFPWKTILNSTFVDNHPTVLQHYDIAKSIAKQLTLSFDIEEDIIIKLHNYIKDDNVFDTDRVYKFTDVQ